MTRICDLTLPATPHGQFRSTSVDHTWDVCVSLSTRDLRFCLSQTRQKTRLVRRDKCFRTDNDAALSTTIQPG